MESVLCYYSKKEVALMLFTILISIAIGLWLLYVIYRRFFDKKNPIGSCGGHCHECHDPLCHLDFVDEYRKARDQ
jgi:uncharacterized protein with PQ loop repeat